MVCEIILIAAFAKPAHQLPVVATPCPKAEITPPKLLILSATSDNFSLPAISANFCISSAALEIRLPTCSIPAPKFFTALVFSASIKFCVSSLSSSVTAFIASLDNSACFSRFIKPFTKPDNG